MPDALRLHLRGLRTRRAGGHLAVAGEMGPGGLIPSTDSFGTALGDIVRCPHCGHMQLEPMPSDALLAGAYAQAASEDYIEEEAGQRETARRALARIEAHQPARGALLDLGCWVGFLLAEARDRGWRTTGVEPSDSVPPTRASASGSTSAPRTCPGPDWRSPALTP